MRSVTIFFRLSFFVSGFQFLIGCSPAIETVPDSANITPIDGAFISYALAREEMTITASYKAGGALSIAAPVTTAYPDLAYTFKLRYEHSPLAIDQPDIILDGALLKQVSSSTQDQTAAEMTSANAVLTQVAAAQTSIATERSFVIAPNPPQTKGPCKTDLQATEIVDLTNETPPQHLVQQTSSTCRIELTVARPSLVKTFDFYGYPKSGDARPTLTECNSAVCFRLTAAYSVQISAELIGAHGEHVPLDPDHPELGIIPPVNETLQILGPDPDNVGFVRFNRRAFSLNSTTLKFQNGLVSEFKSTDPSEIAGVLAVAAAGAATAAIVAKGL